MSTNENLTLITNLFVEDFTTAYKKIKATGKNRLLKYINSFYRRWYYSALIEGTILTPANLMAMSDKNTEQSGSYPSPVMSNYKKISPISFVYTEYILDKHPVVEDFRILLDSCVPDVEFTENNQLATAHVELLIDKLSIHDPFYVEYLTELALELKAIKPIPAIYSHKAQTTAESQKLLSLTNREIFNKIFEASLNLSARCILEILPLNNKIINSEFILALLKKPESTDDIFQQLYYSMGINLNNFLDLNADDNMLDDMYNAMMSSTFFLGVIIDKYFYTLFGYYLKIINPNYVIPYDLASELEYAIEALDNTSDISVGVFSPCSHYTLTNIGFQLLDIIPTEENSIKFPKNISPEIIVSLMLGQISNKNVFPFDIREFTRKDASDKKDSHVFELKIKHTNNKLYWKIFECPTNINLNDLYLEIVFEFGFDATMDYSFFPDLSENPFSEYTSPTNKRRSKKAEDTKLSDIPLNSKDKFLLVLYDTLDPFTSEIIPVKSIKLEIELIQTKEASNNNFYPRVSRISQAFKKLELDDWL